MFTRIFLTTLLVFPIIALFKEVYGLGDITSWFFILMFWFGVSEIISRVTKGE